jgi:hypothetical protein
VPTVFDGPGITISHLRARGQQPDRLLARQRLEHLLASADLYPTGLPPAAILCVRALRDPRPGAIRLEGYATRPPQHWEQAVAASLTDFARHAVRPLHAVVPANAEAVLFADRAEILACLALDWAQGILMHHWWWRSLLRGADVNRIVWSAWLDMPQYAPSALMHLAARGDAVMVVRRMEEAVVSALIERLLTVFHLHHLRQALQDNTSDNGPALTEASLPADQQRDPSGTLAGGESEEVIFVFPLKRLPVPWTERFPVPWAERIPESLDENLTLPRRLLLGVALSLARDSVHIRTASFAWQTRRWLKAEIALETDARIIDQSPRQQPDTRAAFPDDGAAFPDASHKEDEAKQPARHSASSTRSEPDAAPELTTSLSANDAPLDSVLERSDSSMLPKADVSPAAESTVSIDPESPIVTAFGGLFYLLNLAAHLGFYADYASPGQRELELSIWDFVALVGAELMGGMPSDPIWGLLAQLANRDEQTPPGSSFMPPNHWQIDPHWLDAFPDAVSLPWTWSVGEGRLRIKHPFGFLVADAPLDGDPALRAAALRTAYGVDIALQEADGSLSPDETPLRRWLNWLMPYIRARLLRAFGMGDQDDPAVMLIPHTARVFITPAHIDVMLDLNTLPIEIRLAGLDRNPGWIPAAGRVITFHFESGGS